MDKNATNIPPPMPKYQLPAMTGIIASDEIPT